MTLTVGYYCDLYFKISYIYTSVLNFISRGHQGDELTLVAACRDVLRVVSAQEGGDYEDDIGPVTRRLILPAVTIS
jgi:hypothetical protein